jgi:hypothetical protein
MNVRVYYKPDGSVVVIHPAPKARRKGESNQDFLDRVATKAAYSAGLEGLPYDDVDPATLPDRKDRDKWRGSKAQGLRIDPSVVTLAEQRQAVEYALDAELAKPAPNAVTALKLQRQLDTRNY